MTNRLALALVSLPGLAWSQTTFVPVDMAALGVGNADIVGLGTITTAEFPFGSPSTVAGIPYILTSAPSSMWAALNAPGGDGQGDVSLVINLQVNNIVGAYTLANTYWGGPGTYASYRFDFSDGTHYIRNLANGVDVRDFNSETDFWQNTINGTTTTVFYDDSQTATRIDRQWISLVEAGHGGKNLTKFTVTDTGGQEVSRIFLTALTFEAIAPVPEPSTYGLALGAFALAGAALRRRRKPA